MSVQLSYVEEQGIELERAKYLRGPAILLGSSGEWAPENGDLFSRLQIIDEINEIHSLEMSSMMSILSKFIYTQCT